LNSVQINIQRRLGLSIKSWYILIYIHPWYQQTVDALADINRSNGPYEISDMQLAWFLLASLYLTQAWQYDDVVVTSCYYKILGKIVKGFDSIKKNSPAYKPHQEEAFRRYQEYFKHSLQINAPYVFYTDENDEGVLPILKTLRNESFDTKWTHHSLKDFRLARYAETVTPQEMVWMEKVQMMYTTYKRFNDATWYAWIDSGINAYRAFTPPATRWPQRNLTQRWPNKFVYQSFPEFRGKFPIAATAFLVHRDVMEEFVATFYRLIEPCLGDAPSGNCSCHYWYEAPDGQKRHPRHRCRTEQDVFQMLSEVRPDISYSAPDLKGGYNWGAIVTENYKDSHNVAENSELSCHHWVGGVEEAVPGGTATVWKGDGYTWPCSGF
jgi:hypothetical protein